MKKTSTETVYVIVLSDAHADGEGMEIPTVILEGINLRKQVKLLPVFFSQEDARQSYLMEELTTHLPEDRKPETYDMPLWQLEGYLEDNPNIDAVLIVYPERAFPVLRDDFFELLEQLRAGPDADGVLGLSA
jgi:hypothetical protein